MKNSVCEFCNKDFIEPWRLRRHLNSKNGCIEGQKTSFEGQKTSFEGQKTSFEGQKTSLCRYCGIEKIKLGRHEKVCKKKEDEIWNLENELEIEHKVPHKENECEYCRNVQSIGNMKRHKETCEKKKEYLEKLIKMKENKATTINNNTYNDNRTIIYWKDVNVNLDLTHINRDTLHGIIKESIEGGGPPLKIVDKILEKTKELVEENKLNKKCVIINPRDKHILVKTENGVEHKPINEGIDEHEKELCDIAYNTFDGKEVIKSIKTEKEEKWNKKIEEVKEDSIDRCMGNNKAEHTKTTMRGKKIEEEKNIGHIDDMLKKGITRKGTPSEIGKVENKTIKEVEERKTEENMMEMQ